MDIGIPTSELTLEQKRQKYRDGARWRAARRKFLKSVIAKEGTLTCFHCQKPDLKLSGPVHGTDRKMVNKAMKLVATIDHFIPVSNPSVDPFDEANFRVSCSNCNLKRNKKYCEEQKAKQTFKNKLNWFILSLKHVFPFNW